jgi:hypothetical protein
MKLFAIALSGFLAASAVQAQTPAVEGAEILWAGIYRAQIVGTVEQPATASGKTNQLANIVKLQATTTVPARLGTSFGFEYRLWGEPQGSPATIDIVVILPKAGLFNPATQKRFNREKWRPSPNRVGAATIVGYLFEKEWEAVPGIWKFQIWHGSRKLAEQSFCVVSDRKTEPEGRDPSHDDPCHSAATA